MSFDCHSNYSIISKIVPTQSQKNYIINLKIETMKKMGLMIFSLLSVSLTFAQSKKNMEQNILQHEEKFKNLE
jgi:hypothetical protein